MRAIATSLRHHLPQFALALLLGTAACDSAMAANPLEKNFYLSGPRYDGNLPLCESVLNRIASRFAETESTFWNSALRIVAFGPVHETAFRPWQSDNIPRRYCTGRAMLNDGKERKVHFSIIEDGGLASFTSGIEYCMVGVDRNWAYNPACKAARP